MKKLPLLTFLIMALTIGIFALACGSDENDDKDFSSGDKYSWEKDIAEIISADCSNSGCHGLSAPSRTIYENNEKNLLAAKTEVVARLTLDPTNSGYMPKNEPSFAVEKKEKLIGFLNQ